MHNAHTPGRSVFNLECMHDCVQRDLNQKRKYFYDNFYELRKHPELFNEHRDELNALCTRLEAIAVEYKELTKA